MFFAVLVALQTAQAHPNALRIVAHRADLHVDDARVTVRYAVELPAHTHHGGAADDAQSTSQTVAGLQLDGVGELEWTHVEGPTPSSTGSAVIRLVGHAPRIADTVTLADGNYPDLPGSFATTVSVGPGLEVTDCSLFYERDGQWLASRAGRWQLGDIHRSTTVSVRARGGVFETALARLAPAEDVRTAWAARTRAGRDRWTELTTTSWGVAMIVALILGRFVAVGSDLDRPKRLGLLAASTILTTALSAWPIAPLGAVLAVTAGPFVPNVFLPLLVALPLATLGAPGPVVVAAALLWTGAVGRCESPRPRLLRGALVLTGVAALVRVWAA